MTLRPNEPMKPKVEQYKQFAKWFRDWFEVIQAHTAGEDGMRSTQFDDHFPFQEGPEEHRGRNEPGTLCETLKRLGFAQNNQVKLYGKVFDLVSNPVIVGANFVFVDALEQRLGKVMRIRVPPTIVQAARTKRRAA